MNFRYATRGLARSPGFTSVAVLTLALGIGGATAIFSVADAVVLRPLPYRDPDRLVVIWQNNRDRNQPFLEISYPAFREWRDRSRLFRSLAAMPAVNNELVLTGRGDPTPLEGRWVTGEFFSVLGVSPALGRALGPEDDHPGAAAVVVLSDQLWRNRFGADRAVVGASITLDNKPHTIVGVMPPGFTYPKGAQFWVPVGPAAGLQLVENQNVYWMIAVGRLESDATLEAARTELTGIWRQKHRPYFKVDSHISVVTPLSDTIFGPTRLALLGLLGAVVLVLIIACANVAGLLLVRATRRHSDLTIRLALGASRRRLIADALTDSSLLALAGGAGGLAIAAAVTPLIVAMSPADVPRLDQVAVNSRAFAFAAGISALGAVLSALAPIALARRTSIAELPRSSSQRTILGRTRAGAAFGDS